MREQQSSLSEQGWPAALHEFSMGRFEAGCVNAEAPRPRVKLATSAMATFVMGCSSAFRRSRFSQAAASLRPL
jgi:hypothetical protein